MSYKIHEGEVPPTDEQLEKLGDFARGPIFDSGDTDPLHPLSSQGEQARRLRETIGRNVGRIANSLNRDNNEGEQ